MVSHLKHILKGVTDDEAEYEKWYLAKAAEVAAFLFQMNFFWRSEKMYGVLPTSQSRMAISKPPSKTPQLIVGIVTVIILIVLLVVAYLTHQNKTFIFAPYLRNPSTTLNMYQPFGEVRPLTDDQINNRRILVCQSLDRLRSKTTNDQSVNYAKATYLSLNCDAYPLSAWIS